MGFMKIRDFSPVEEELTKIFGYTIKDSKVGVNGERFIFDGDEFKGFVNYSPSNGTYSILSDDPNVVSSIERYGGLDAAMGEPSKSEIIIIA